MQYLDNVEAVLVDLPDEFCNPPKCGKPRENQDPEFKRQIQLAEQIQEEKSLAMSTGRQIALTRYSFL